MRERYRQIFPTAVLFSAGLIWIGFLLDEPGNIITGLYRIVVSENILITDYVYIAGPGAALINSGIVTGISICILKFSGASFNGDGIDVGFFAIWEEFLQYLADHSGQLALCQIS